MTVSSWKKKISPEVSFSKLPNTRAWKLTSEFVRKKALIKWTFYCRCYTCGASVLYTKAVAGHSREKRGNAAIYFNLDGIRCQCSRCNRHLHGNYGIFVLKLIREIGRERVEKLYRLAQKSKRWRKNELEEIEKDVKQKLAKL